MTSDPGIQRARAGDVELAYETFGDRDDPPLLLVMGLATQMVGWPDEFCAGLADRGAPDITAVLGGDRSAVPYRLADLADDTVGLLDALDLDSAHVVGASMGGMIAQLVAIRHPGRV